MQAADQIVNGVWYEITGTNTAKVKPVPKDEAAYSGEIFIDETITIEDNVYYVTEIGNDAFQNVTGVTSVTIPATVTFIGNNAFQNCSGLTRVEFASIASLFQIEYFGSTSNPLYLGKAQFAFTNGDSTEDIAIPAGITEINRYALYGCKKNTFTLTITEGVTTIHEKAFWGCEGLTAVSIPSTVTTIENDAFQRCSNLTDVTLLSPSGTIIGVNVFQVCQRIKNVTFASVEALCGMEFYNQNSHPLTQGNNVSLSFYDGSSAENVVIPANVTHINKYAFNGCRQLKSLTLSEGVESIGACAFEGCYALTSVTLPGTLQSIDDKAFNNCTGLSKVDYPNELTLCSIIYADASASPLNYAGHLYINGSEKKDITIPAAALENGNKIRAYTLCGAKFVERVNIPGEVTTIGTDAFKNCTGLKYVSYANEDQIYNMTYENEDANPLKYAQNFAIGSNFIHEITISKNVENYAFQKATWLQKVTLTNAVTSIGSYAFSGCTALTSIDIPETVTSIETAAFEGCALEKIEIPENCHLATNVFKFCRSLNTAIMPQSMTEIPEGTFYECTGLRSITLSDQLTRIGKSAFYGCDKLTTPPFSNSLNTLESIGESAFYNCAGFTNLILGDDQTGKVETIWARAFQNCKNISMVSLPATVKEIYDGAFDGCTSLKDIYCHSANVPTTDTNIFGGRENEMTLYVINDEAMSNYSQAYPWKTFKSIIVKQEHTLSFYINGKEIEDWRIKRYSGYTISEEERTRQPQLGEGQIWSGWDKEIPTTMPGEDMRFDGYISTETVIGHFTYKIVPAQGEESAKAVVIGVEALEVPTKLTVPATVSYESMDYPVTEIEAEAFKDAVMIDEIILPEGIRTIGEGAFFGCRGLSTITIPATVTAIGQKAFSGCSGLTKVEGYRLTTVSNEAFADCQNLMSIGLATVTEMGKWAFARCKSLNMESLPINLKKIGDQALTGTGIRNITIRKDVYLGEEVFKNCANLESVTFEEGFTQKLPKLTFWGCTSLKTFTLASGMEQIGEGAFKGCIGLTTLTEDMLGHVSMIGTEAFMGCSQLTSITLPGTLSTLSGKAFAGCTSLIQIIAKSNDVPVGAFDAFSNETYQNDATWVYVNNDEAAAKYQVAEPWKNFKNPISVAKTYDLTYQVNGETYKIDAAEQVFHIMVGTPLVLLEEPTDADRADRPFSGWTSGWDEEGNLVPAPTVMPNKDTTIQGRFKYEVKFYDGEPKDDDSNRLLTGDEYPDGFWYWFGENYTLPADELRKDNYIYSLFLLSEDEEIEIKDDDVASHHFTMGKEDVAVKVVYKDAVAEVTQNGIIYKILIFENRAEVVGKTEPFPTTDVVIPATINYNKKDYPVTVIQPSVFAYNTIITSVNLGNVTTIGDHTFYKCLNLGEIKNGLAKVESIGDGAFGNTKLTSVTIPATVTQMGNSVFYACNNLEEVDVNTEVISENVFAKCGDLQTVVLGANVKTIGNNAFDGCSKLTSITLPASLTNIGERAFDYVFSKGGVIEVKAATANAFPKIEANTFSEDAYLNVELRTSLSADELPDVWKNFHNVEGIIGDGAQQCEMPTISFNVSGLTFTCATEGATIVYAIKSADDAATTKYDPDGKVILSKMFEVTAYAKKSGMKSSDIVTETFCFEQGDVNGDGKIDVSDYIGVANIILNGSLNVSQ